MICSCCHRDRDDLRFGLRADRPGSRRTVCNECLSERKRLKEQSASKEQAANRRAEKRAYVAANPDKRSKWSRDSYDRRKAWRDSLKEGQPCVDCGQVFPPCCMDWDHVRGEKCFNVSQAAIFKSKEVTLREISKCELVCANCHRIRTHRRKETCCLEGQRQATRRA